MPSKKTAKGDNKCGPSMAGTNNSQAKNLSPVCRLLHSTELPLSGSLTTPAGDVPISGTFDEASLQVSFNDASAAGEVLLTTFFTGKVVIAENRVEGFAGSWTEQTLGGIGSFSGGGKTGAKSGSLKAQYKTGGWFEFNRDPLWRP